MNNMDQINEAVNAYERVYLNKMQIRAFAVDANVLIARIARAAGKTEGIFGPRIHRVAWDMPGEKSYLIHKTYVDLFANIVPALISYFSRPYGPEQKPLLERDKDFVVGTTKIPIWFKKPRVPVAYPKHSMIFRTGHHLQLVSSDQPDSAAGASGVHAFIEELKHNKGEKLKSRIFPGLRGGLGKTRRSPYYEGITGVSDTARVDLGEDNWFEEYEKLMDGELINEIWTVYKKVNTHLVRFYKLKLEMSKERDPTKLRTLQKTINHHKSMVDRWMPRLRDMRHSSVYYMTASTFVNKDFLGAKFFKQQLDTLSMDEFLVAICNIALKKVADMFFIGYNHNLHGFTDGFKYESLMNLTFDDNFKVTADLLKYFKPDKPLELGYDPGFFSSITVAQHNKRENEVRVLKEFTYYAQLPQAELARQIWEFFGPYHKNKKIELWYDRAGNKTREELKRTKTDARLMKRELENYGFRVELKNEGQRTIYYWEHYKLLEMLFSTTIKSMPNVKVDLNNCKNLNSSIYRSPKKEQNGKIILDKTSEKTIAWQYQAGLTTQLSSAFMYYLYGKFSDLLPDEMSSVPVNLPENIIAK